MKYIIIIKSNLIVDLLRQQEHKQQDLSITQALLEEVKEKNILKQERINNAKINRDQLVESLRFKTKDFYYLYDLDTYLREEYGDSDQVFTITDLVNGLEDKIAQLSQEIKTEKKIEKSH